MPTRLTNNKDRINTVDISRCTVYRLGRAELNTNIVSLSGSGENTGYLIFTLNPSSTETEWTNFLNWWKKNPNLIILGCKILNIATAGSNKGYYWCPVNRAPNINRTDNYTNKLEFTIWRNDTGIYNQADQTIYEFYFINLTH